jgi:hypothetical protein
MVKRFEELWPSIVLGSGLYATTRGRRKNVRCKCVFTSLICEKLLQIFMKGLVVPKKQVQSGKKSVCHAALEIFWTKFESTIHKF